MGIYKDIEWYYFWSKDFNLATIELTLLFQCYNCSTEFFYFLDTMIFEAWKTFYCVCSCWFKDIPGRWKPMWICNCGLSWAGGHRSQAIVVNLHVLYSTMMLINARWDLRSNHCFSFWTTCSVIQLANISVQPPPPKKNEKLKKILAYACKIYD